MHVVVCSVIPPLFLPWQLDFASPRSHYCMNVTECFVFPSLLLSLQMAFASPRSHYCEGPKCPRNGLKMGPFHPFVHPKWSRMRSGKMRF